VGGVSEVISADVGILVPPRDQTSLAGAMSQMAADPERRQELGARARERMPAMYSADRLLADIIDLYDELVAPH
jgi:glycosyltransferase involved in cell wall biosynthesis